MDEGRKKFEPHPRASANCLSALTFWWILGLFGKGWKKELGIDDLYDTLPDHKSSRLGDLLEKTWHEELTKCRKLRKSPSLTRVLVKCFGFRVAIFGLVLIIMETIIRISQPVLLGRLLRYFTPGAEDVTFESACWYATGVAACSGMYVILMHPYVLGVMHLGMQVRVGMCSLMYRKSLRLALGRTTVGQVINLMSNDVSRFDMAAMLLNEVWIGPVVLVICCYLMWSEMGFSSMLGVTTLLLTIPLQLFLGRKASQFRFKTATRTDERVRLMNEIISGIQVIKMYAWEDAFASLVALARRLEVRMIRFASYIHAINKSFVMFTTRLTVYMSVVAYVLLGNNITAEKVFVMMSYYNIIRNTMTMFFPQAVSQIAEMSVSIKRIQTFLLLEEVSGAVTSSAQCHENTWQGPSTANIGPFDMSGVYFQLDKTPRGSRSSPGVSIENATAQWSMRNAEPTLSDITLELKPRDLTMVIGQVGAGKSSLIQVILGELTLLSGHREVKGQLSYASQEPWLFSATVRQNVTFGCVWDAGRYREVIRACALERDLTAMPQGDLTLVGERGITLSGGQRARISLARAVYKQAEVYLLDDPLSAVDAHVARHLVDECLRGPLLRNKCVLLVTHQLQFLPLATHIIVLENGRVETEGCYSDLTSSAGLDLSQLLAGDGDGLATGASRLHSIVRQISVQSTVSSVKEVEEEKIIETAVAELRSSGSVSGRVYGKYLSAGGGCGRVFTVFIMFVLAQVAGSATDFWLTFWTNMEESAANSRDPSLLDTRVCIVIHSALVVSLITFTLVRSGLFVNTCMKASVSLHDTMFGAVTRTAMAFFNNNPAGRILNRFSGDMGSVDERLPQAIMDAMQIGLSLLGIISVVSIVNYWMLIPTLVIAVIFYFLRVVFLTTSRGIKRVEGITRSPVYTHLTASLQGLATIRAFGAEEVLIAQFDNHQDLNSSAWYLFICSSRAFGYWLDLVCFVYISLVSASFLLMDRDVMGGNVGLAITQAMGLTGMFQWGMRQSAEVENNMTSVERVVEFCDLDKEVGLENCAPQPPEDWPHNGEIVFERLTLIYPPSKMAVLKEVSFTIHAGEKVGIVGRTGAGKSSLISALFRLSEITTGRMMIDNFDTSVLDLARLRSSISIIPQEPVLFSGTMRKNLDPFDEYSDEVLWKVLLEVELKEVVCELSSGLYAPMAEGGSNLSVGQRQLVCLARAILRNNRILVMDEATANVDHKTDSLIQNTIRSKFAHCTVLTIAHRLNTVMDCDRVLVMQEGRVAEFDYPLKLLTNPSSIFSRMARQQGTASFN